MKNIIKHIITTLTDIYFTLSVLYNKGLFSLKRIILKIELHYVKIYNDYIFV
jgi:hypothetical protein